MTITSESLLKFLARLLLVLPYLALVLVLLVLFTISGAAGWLFTGKRLTVTGWFKELR